MDGGETAAEAAEEEVIPHFERFAAIDWSGAKGKRHKGIAIAVAEAGDKAPRLIERTQVWSRS